MGSKKEQTIALVRGLREAHAAAFKRRPRRGKVPAPAKPLAIQSEYLKGIRELALAPLRNLVEKLAAALPGILADAENERRDAFAASQVRAFLEKLAANAVPKDSELARLARKFGERTSDFQREQLKRQLKAAMGVDPLFFEPRSVAARVEHFTEANIALIKTIPQRFLSEVQGKVMEGVRQGIRAESLAAELEERYGVAESNAARIARDQVGKFFGELNRVRQGSLGIEGYFWRGVLDNREREEHEEREGERFSWDDPPEGGHPGEEVNCRCFAEPDLSEMLEET